MAHRYCPAPASPVHDDGVDVKHNNNLREAGEFRISLECFGRKLFDADLWLVKPLEINTPIFLQRYWYEGSEFHYGW